MSRSDRPFGTGGGHGFRREGGYVTAEAAVTVPVLVLFSTLLLWGLMAAAGQIRCVDAARAGARAAARSEPDAVVREAARAAAPSGADVAVVRSGDQVRVRVTARSPGLAVGLHADAVALAEDSVMGESAAGGQVTAVGGAP